MAGDLLLPDSGPWIARTLARFKAHYLGDHGLIVTSVDGATGAITDPEPLIADFGDVLPFLARFGDGAFAREQVAAARASLGGGLYREPDGGLRLFTNHDWLLGLIELHEMSGEADFLAAAVEGADIVLHRFVRSGLLIDETPDWRRPRTLLGRSSAFNLGYVELLADLHVLTNEPRFLDAARAIAAAYVRTGYFAAHGVFGTVFCSWSRTADRLAARFAQMRARLFKDNTNGVWSLLALHRLAPDPALAQAIERWIAGFEARFWNGGDVHLWHGHDRPHQVSVKAAFAALDLLCDLHLAGFEGRAIALARGIGDRWTAHQWSNGLFPVAPDGDSDHLDCNTDMTVALMKLAGITGERGYAEAASRCARATVAAHEGEFGMVLGVDASGGCADARVVVKYQSLALKLALLPADPKALIGDAELLKLLRDR